MQKIYAKATQFPPASNHIDSQSDCFSKDSSGGGDSGRALSQPAENNCLNAPSAEPVHEHVVLVEQNNRLEAGMINTDGEVKKRLMRTANRAVVIALDDENASAS
jgi:hypothetical protein